MKVACCGSWWHTNQIKERKRESRGAMNINEDNEDHHEDLMSSRRMEWEFSRFQFSWQKWKIYLSSLFSLNTKSKKGEKICVLQELVVVVIRENEQFTHKNSTMPRRHKNHRERPQFNYEINEVWYWTKSCRIINSRYSVHVHSLKIASNSELNFFFD